MQVLFKLSSTDGRRVKPTYSYTEGHRGNTEGHKVKIAFSVNCCVVVPP
jgi:hypothetical protein